ncbi:MAG TPA: DUF1444 family protein [Rhizomicrobium sp.]|nr:DUF1444 family protein [Rhizomicrobium sp.]
MSLFSALSSWLGGARAQTRRFANIVEFREFAIAVLAQQPGVDSAVADSGDPAKFTVMMDGLPLNGDLTNIFGYINAYPNEDADKLIERFIRSIIQGKTGIVDDSQIVAVIRTREYVDFLKERNLDDLCEPLAPGLMIVYMMDLPDAMKSIASKDMPGKDLLSVRKIALGNVLQWLPKVVTDDQLQPRILYQVQDNTMLSPSLILLDEFWKSIEPRFPGDVLIALPRRDQLFIFADGSPQVTAMARHLIDVTIDENFNLLSSNLYARRGGKIVLVTD